jgi:transposase
MGGSQFAIVGPLNAWFRPPAEICAVRSLMRHRNSLMRTACQHLLRVQKSLDQMNVQLHHAVTDITGYTGLEILDAIVAGERDPEALARLRDYRCKKNEAEIAKALRGDWREEHLFTRRQSLEAWRFHQNLMADCDQQIASRMDALEDRGADARTTLQEVRRRPDRRRRREHPDLFGIFERSRHRR